MGASIKICTLLTILFCIVIYVSAQNDGKYRPPVRGNKGKYVHKDEGQYIPSDRWRYVHVDDQRHLGKYHHIHNPYNGGFGPYSGLLYPYDHNGDSSNRFPTSQIAPLEIITEEPKNQKTYHDEGGWKIIRQEGKMNKKKYDFLYETENGIYAEEHAKLNKEKDSQVEGTNIDSGYYQYTGDDGKLYRVDYSAGENGFVPTGDHIPTPPPVPKEIQRLLEYLKEKNQL